MRLWLLAAAVFAAGPSSAAGLELVPKTAVPAAPTAAAGFAFAAAPLTASGALSAAAAPSAAPLAAAPLAAAPLAAGLAAPAAALAPAVRAGAGPRPALIRSVSAPALELSRRTDAGAAAAAEKDFDARAQLGEPVSGGAPEPVMAPRPDSRPRFSLRRAPGQSRRMANETIPGWLAAELPVAAGKLGVTLSPARREEVLARSKVWVYSWHSFATYEVSGLPDGHYDPKFGIRVMLKTNWRGLKDPETHFRVLYAHEYAHWLQHEGLVTRRYGVEVPSVAVEQLRAMELVGWEGMKDGRVSFIGERNLAAFERGREWARGDMKDPTALMFSGVLGGAAYEVGRIAGRPEAAWEFLNLVIAGQGALAPRAAYERVVGSRPGETPAPRRDQR